jgi:hypothetical protein
MTTKNQQMRFDAVDYGGLYALPIVSQPGLQTSKAQKMP